jgi:hypothetical protein
MKRIRFAFAVLLLPIGLSGCLAGRMNNTMASWQGHHYSELVMSWGPPQAVYDDGAGGRLLLYTQSRQWTTPGQAITTTNATATVYDNVIWGQAQSRTQFIPPQTSGYTAWRMFAINQAGVIYNWSWRGF